MEWSVYTISPNLIIAPGYSEQWYEDPQKWMVIDTNDSITLKYKNQKFIIPSGFIGIGSSLHIMNHMEKPIKVKVTVFYPTQTRHTYQETINPIIISKVDKNHSKYVSRFEKIFRQNVFDSQTMEEVCHCFAGLYEIAIQLNRKPKKKLEGKIDPRLIWIHRMIRHRYQEQFTLEVLAERLQCNSVYLSNTYTKVFKVSLMQHLQITRMKKAKQLLEETNLSISEITQCIGYISKSQFASYFKKHVGLTPSKYRRKIMLKKERMGLWQ